MFRHVLIRYLQRNSNKVSVLQCKNNNHNLQEVCNVPTNCVTISCIHTTDRTCAHKQAHKEESPRGNVHHLSEKDYLVKLKSDPDVFGSANDADPEIDEGDLKEEQFLKEKPLDFQKLSTKQYADIIKEFLRKRKIKEAIDVVEQRMLKVDKVQPENYLYNLLIGACGRVGYTKKAFSLYNEMKRRALKITPGTYTALFNACSNSPWPTTDGLTRARHLRNIIIENNYEPNVTNYNAMIKAFGWCGDLETAFALVDEMVAKKFSIKDDTINFLLQACIHDTEAGFRHALLVWRKFVNRKIKPSVYSYNLMLRCIRDCGLGDVETTKDVINRLISSSALLLEESRQKLIRDRKSGDPNALEVIPNYEAETKQALQLNKPNLMGKMPHLGNIVSLSKVTSAEDRLILVGGYLAFLEDMKANGCIPNIKTFTQLLDNIPSTLAAEKELLQLLKKNHVNPDIDFFNMLIKKRSMRLDYENARAVLTMIETARMQPDLVTYGVLALGCKTKEEAISLLQEMNESNYRINIEILGAMLRIACHQNNFPYILHILEICQTEDVKPGQIFLNNLKNFKRKCKKISNDLSDPVSKSKAFQKGYQVFKMRYKTWLEEVPMDDSENVHPWQQYRQPSDTNILHYKDKAEKNRFKPVHTSLFRQKTRVQNVVKRK